MDEAQALREQAARYRHMRADFDDQRIKDVLTRLAEELDAKAAAAESRQRGSEPEVPSRARGDAGITK